MTAHATYQGVTRSGATMIRWYRGCWSGGFFRPRHNFQVNIMGLRRKLHREFEFRRERVESLNQGPPQAADDKLADDEKGCQPYDRQADFGIIAHHIESIITARKDHKPDQIGQEISHD